MFGFEKLEVWQKAIEFSDCIYEATQSFPDNERYGLTSQMRRAAVSIASNIAEGSGRISKTEFARFVSIAYSSMLEVICQAHIAKRQKMLAAETFDAIYTRSEQIARMLSGLRSSLNP